jgi:hypothetical protein
MPFNLVDLLLVADRAGRRRHRMGARLPVLRARPADAGGQPGRAFIGYREAADWWATLAPALGVWIAPLAFVGIFLLVHFVLGTVVLRLAARLPRAVHAPAQSLLGLLPGSVNGAIHAVVAAVLLLTLPLGPASAAGRTTARWPRASPRRPNGWRCSWRRSSTRRCSGPCRR